MRLSLLFAVKIFGKWIQNKCNADIYMYTIDSLYYLTDMCKCVVRSEGTSLYLNQIISIKCNVDNLRFIFRFVFYLFHGSI